MRETPDGHLGVLGLSYPAPRGFPDGVDHTQVDGVEVEHELDPLVRRLGLLDVLRLDGLPFPLGNLPARQELSGAPCG